MKSYCISISLEHRADACRLMSNFFMGSIVANRLEQEHEPNP